MEVKITKPIGRGFGGVGVTREGVAAQIEGAKPGDVELLINSPGGDPQEAFSIVELLTPLRPFSAKIVGTAASAATIFAALADDVAMSFGGRFMVHNAWQTVSGDARKFEQIAQQLEAYSADMASMYVEKTGQSLQAIRALMDAETWMTARQAKNEGFVDRVLDLKPRACAELDEWDEFDYPRRSSAPEPPSDVECEAEIRRLRASRERQAQLAKFGVYC